jgi:pyrimidine-specific ribonucleoside hydrolase
MSKRPVIIDCDPGHDDAIALLIALASDELDVKGITTVGGNNKVEKTTINALKVLELTGMTHIPVAVGRSNPLMKEIRVADDVHGESGMDGPELKEPAIKPVELSAVEFIAKVVEESEEKVTLVAVGPFTNIGVFLLSYPQLHEKIECISVMGGGYLEGNRTAVAEFNIWQDPEAARVVMRSGIPVLLHGLDVTHKALIKKEEFSIFRNEKGPIFQFVADLLDFYSICYTGERKLEGCPMHDSCAVANLIDPTLFKGESAVIDIELDGEITRGACIIDLRPKERRPVEDNGKVIFDVDRKRFLDLIIESCRKLESRLSNAQ